MAKKQNNTTNQNTPEIVIRKRMRKLADKADITGFFTKLVMMAVVLWVMFGFVFGLTPMPNKDMYPKINNGDLLFYYRLHDRYLSDNVVVYEVEGQQYVGRIVAKSGDEVEITDDYHLIINGNTQVEENIYYRTVRYVSNVEYPFRLGENEFFILGDQREKAEDSRYFGAVSKSNIKGKVLTVIRRTDI